VLFLTGAANGCESEGGVKSLGPGKHPVTKSLRGVWKAKDATRGCRWTVQTKTGSVISKGSWSLSNREQHVLLGTGNLGMVFWPNDKCGRWTK